MIEGIKTKQDLFNHVARHLIRQNEQSRGGVGDTCMYRNGRGLSCAIGCCINGENYRPSFEGKAFSGGIYIAVEKSIGRQLESDEIGMLSDLRKIHDDWEPMDWFYKLNEIVDEYRLERTPELQGLTP